MRRPTVYKKCSTSWRAWRKKRRQLCKIARIKSRRTQPGWKTLCFPRRPRKSAFTEGFRCWRDSAHRFLKHYTTRSSSAPAITKLSGRNCAWMNEEARGLEPEVIFIDNVGATDSCASQSFRELAALLAFPILVQHNQP